MREDVLKIDFQPVFDKWAWRITKQNEEVFERGKFHDEDLNVKSTGYPFYYPCHNTLCIRGTDEERDEDILICNCVEKLIIEERVKLINEKYGILKRWRGKRDEKYYYVDTHNGCIAITTEKDFEDDNFNYEIGNYFKTKELAEKFIEDLKQFSKEWYINNNN